MSTPSQQRTIDPFSSYNSDIANRLTHIVTDNVDCILYPSLITATINGLDDTIADISVGRCVKDDVVIQLLAASTLDFGTAANYVSGGIWDEVGYYYIVLSYEYAKTDPPNEASILIIKPDQRTGELDEQYDTDEHLFLACAEVSDSGGYQIDAIYGYDPDDTNIRRVLKGIDPNLGLVNIVETAIDYDADPDDGTILVTGNTTITLPLIAVSDKEIRIIKGDVAPTVTTVERKTASSDLIETVTSIQMTAIWNEITVLPNNINDVWVEV